MKFTRATPEKAAAPLLMIELRAEPFPSDPFQQWHNYIQICGPNTNGVHKKLDRFIQKYMRLACKVKAPGIGARVSSNASI